LVTQIRRFSQIVEILGKYGYGIALARLFPGESRVTFPPRTHPAEPAAVYERVRLALEELGPTFVKFGQIMSTRSDILPDGLIAELKKLQDRVKPVPFDEILPVIETCCPRAVCFRTIDPVPVASASIAQVHRAVLIDGTPVAIKVQRPGIRDLIETDLLILQSIAERVESVFPDTRIYNPTGIVRDFTRQIRRELDFILEAKTADRMRQNFRDVPGIHVPAIYPEYSCSRLLVMEFVEGVRIDDRDGILAMGLDPGEIARRGFRAYLKMIVTDGFFHGDPHPGNLLVAADGSLIMLDFGIAGIVRPEKQQYVIRFLIALMQEDTDLLLRSMENLGVALPDEIREPLQDDLFFLLQDLGVGYTIAQFSFPRFITELTEVLRRYRIRVPADLMLLFKVLVMVLDIGVRLDPEFSVRKELSPYLTDISKRTIVPAGGAKKHTALFHETADTVLSLPRHLNLALRQFATGIVRVDVVDADIRGVTDALDAASDKFTIGIVAGSLVIGSSLILRALPGALPPGASWAAVLGYSVAALAGFYALYHIARLRFLQGL